VARHIPQESISTFLGQTSIFRGCRLDDLLSLARVSEQQSFRPGASILPPGKPVTSLGLLASGRAALVQIDAATGAQSRVDQLVPGDPLGEIGLLLGGANPLAVLAEEECEVLLFGKPVVEGVLRKNPEASLALARRLASRFVQVALLGARGGGQLPRESAPPPAATAPSGAPFAGGEKEPATGEGRIAWVEVASYNLTPEILGMVPSALVRKHRLLPLQLRGTRLTVGMVNPRSVEAVQDLRRVLHNVDPEVVAISVDDFNQAFVRLKLDSGLTRGQRIATSKALQVSYSVDQDKEAEKSQLVIGNEVVGLFDRILLEALELGASDVHLEPESAGVKIRFRVQGTLVDRQEFVPASYATPLVARIKVLSELDITERRLPQDGRILAQVGRQEINLRVSTMAVARGEKAVLRIIDPGDVMRPLHQIFLHPDSERAARASLAEPFGAIIVAGPTGSGKSSTLYSMLNERRLSRPDNNIVTVEDPVEYMLTGVTQVPVIPRVGFGFAQALRGLMRQDPDVIMVGELRDAETTGIMVEAALTGHLVLTSIHGNDAAAVVQRLQHLGTDPVLLSQALSVVVVQRLAKRLCPNCVQDSEVAPALLENLVSRRIVAKAGASKLPRPVGCEACNKTGYLGRLAVQEVLQMGDAVRLALAEGATPQDLIECARTAKRFVSFAQSAAFLMARRLLAPGDALLIVSD
jgi:type IV pilus assembly protein PilB